MSPPSPPASGSTHRRDAFLTATSQIAGMGLGAILALLVLLLFGNTSQTDGFFAAYGAFAFLSSIAQGLRVSLPALLIASDQERQPLDRYLGAVLLLSMFAAVPMVILGRPVASLLVGDLGSLAMNAASTALLLLWLAGTLQLLAGLCSAALGVQGRFGGSAVAYALGAAAGIFLTVGLAEPLGISAVSVGVASGGLLTGGTLWYQVVMSGWRPTLGRGTLSATRSLVSGSAGYFALQSNFLITIAFATRIGEGTATTYAYAFFAALLLVGATSGTASIVLAGSLTRTWDRRVENLDAQLLAVTRAGLLLAIPAMAVAILLGDDFLRMALPGALSSTDVDRLVTTLLTLTGFLVASIVGTVPLVAAFAQGRHARVALVATLAIAAHLAITGFVAGTERLELLGLATSASQTVFLLGIVATVYRRALLRPAVLIGKEILRLSALAVVSFGGSSVATNLLGSGLWQVVAAFLGMLLFLAAVKLTSRPTWAIFRALLPRKLMGEPQRYLPRPH